MLNPETGEQQTLHMELKPENKSTAYPANRAKNKLHGEWKTEGLLLICTGNTELKKQTMTLKIAAKSITFKKKP